jgi:hypothetical protein
MKTSKNTITQPELFLDGSRGIYIPQTFAQIIAQELKDQIRPELLEGISNPDNEHYWDSWDSILNGTYKTKSGQKFWFEQNDDLWLIPACFARTKEYKQNWLNN